MKKLILTAAVTLFAGVASLAQDAESIRVYINPGHGSWTGNDRPQQIIGKPVYSATNTDTTGFFESNTNLIKGFGVLEELIQMGCPFDRTLNQEGERWQIGAARDLSQNLVMSRVKNGPYEANNTTSSPNYQLYNRNLTEIAAEVEYNEFDIFISIHSNAATEGSTTNYHLYMYRGRNGRNNVLAPGSYEMAEAGWVHSFGIKHMGWSTNSVYINGDIDFMGSGSSSTNSLGYTGYLGVLKHGCPGYLVEGYFHTYQPARHRGMNFDADFEEGCAYARGVADYFEFDQKTTGDLYGIVRDAHKKFTHNLYNPNGKTEDVWLPLNGVKVQLHKGDNVIGEYTTDQFYNGAFLFFNLEPGDYTLTFQHEQYREIEPVEVTVKPGTCVYPIIKLENVDYELASDHEVDYPDENTNPAIGAPNEYTLKTDYQGMEIEGLAGKTVRRVIARADYLYILALDNDNQPSIIVYDTRQKKVVATPDLTGIEGGMLKISDIQVTGDFNLVAMPMAELHLNDASVPAGQTRGKINVYRWDRNRETNLPTGAPIKWFTLDNSGSWKQAICGQTFSFTGNSKEGYLIYSCESSVASDKTKMRTVSVKITGGDHDTETIAKPRSAVFAKNVLGDDFQFVTSPLGNDHYFVTGSGADYGVIEFKHAHTQNAVQSASLPEGLLDNTISRVAFLRSSGKSYMLATDGNSTTAPRMFDVTNGLDKATEVTLTIEDDNNSATQDAIILPAAVSNVTRNKKEIIERADIVLYALQDGKLTRMSTEGNQNVVTPAAIAYDLTTSGDTKSGYTLSFKSSQQANSATVTLTSTTNSSDKHQFTISPVEKGINTIEVNSADLTDKASYNWDVTIESNCIPAAGKTFEAPAKDQASRGGVTWIGDTESPNFGKIVASAGYAQGLDVYTPDGTLQGSYFVKTAPFQSAKLNSPYRLGNRDGIVYITDWSDAGSGYWMFDPQNPETVTDFLGGTNDGTGAHIIDGKSIGGGSTCVTFYGKGENTSMFTFAEDYPTGNASMIMARYDIGTATSWTKAPDATFSNLSAKETLTGTNVEAYATSKGVFVSQATSQNSEKVPAFVIIDSDGKIIYNSVEIRDYLTSCGSGIAVTQDLTTLAVATKADGITIWDIDWKGTAPAMTLKYTIPSSEGDDEICQLAFDNANNLYAYHRSAKGLRGYALRNDAPKATTAAPKAQIVLGDAAGVEDIAVDAPAENAVYYNLQGVRVDANNLSTGIYIKVAGKKATKVLVK